MKSVILILIYLSSFAFFYFLLSLFGLLWVNSYKEIITEPGWFMLYTIALGSWLGYLPSLEYYKANEDHFDNVNS